MCLLLIGGNLSLNFDPTQAFRLKLHAETLLCYGLMKTLSKKIPSKAAPDSSENLEVGDNEGNKGWMRGKT